MTENLTFSNENLRVFRRDGKIVAVEERNSHLTRYITKEAGNREDDEIFGTGMVANGAKINLAQTI